MHRDGASPPAPRRGARRPFYGERRGAARGASGRSGPCAALVALVAVLAGLHVAVPARAARPDIEGCGPVLAALAAAAAQARIESRGETLAGRHPLGHVSLHAFVDGDSEQVVDDGHAFRPQPWREVSGSRAAAAGLPALEPEGDCEALPHERVAGRDAAVFAYPGPAERGLSRVRLWIDRAAGLPVRAEIDSAEMSFAPVLSRPTRPPQVTLKPTGRRYVERRTFRFGDAVSPPR